MTDAGHKARQRLLRKALARFGGRARTPSSPPRTRSWAAWIVGALALVLSFLITLWLTRPEKPPSPAVKSMTQSGVSDWRTLIAAVKAAGLKGSSNVKGAIDEIARRDDGRVTVVGWAGEVGNGGAPLEILVFVDGESALTMRTEGRHAGVTGGLGLADAATAQDVSFRGTVACGRGQKLIVVAIAESGSYGYFSPRACP
jgi:hypothetical protein